MPREALRDTLNNLRSTLQERDSLDSDSLELLAQLHEDIEVLLELSSEARPEQHAQVQTHLSSSLQRLEATHPQLSSAMSNLLNILNSMGV